MLKPSRNRILLGLALALGLAGLSTAVSAATLKIGTEGGYPPWSMVDASGKVMGFDADVGDALCDKLQTKCRFVVQSFDSLIPALQAKRFDLVISGMSVTPEREKIISFSLPYVTEDSAFVLPTGDALLGASSAEDLFKGLAGKSIGVQSGTTQAAFLQKHVPGIQIRTYDTQDQMQMDLAAGRMDGAFSELTAQNKFVQEAGKGSFEMPEVVVKGSLDPDVLGPGIGVGINKENTELKEQVDAALCELIEEGAIKAASEKWFGVDMSNYEACN